MIKMECILSILIIINSSNYSNNYSNNYINKYIKMINSVKI